MRTPARLLVTAVVAAALLIASWQLFFFYRDNFATHFPIKSISAPFYRSGIVPFWDFADGGGQPLAGNPNTLTFYPDNVLYLLFPVYVAFNLHFFLHLLLGWFAMRALTGSRSAAWLYVLSGAAISATAFYNLVTAIFLVPLAFLAAERRSPLLLGAAFGLMALAGEPVTIGAATLGVAILLFRKMRPSRLALAVVISLVIALPQLIAYREISREVERGVQRYSARTVLNASFEPKRLVELAVGPMSPLLNDESHDERLFSTVFLCILVIPAVAVRSRFTLIAGTLVFLALGRFNPLIAWTIGHVERLRLLRFPEKLAIPLVVALVVLVAPHLRNPGRLWLFAALVPVGWASYDLGGWQAVAAFVGLGVAAVLTLAPRRAILVLALLPLLYWDIRAVPLDWFSRYQLAPVTPRRVFVAPMGGAPSEARDEYRLRAARLEPLFGATAGLRYGLDRSPDGMFSALTRIAAERFASTRNLRYLRIAGCDVDGALPRAFVVPRAIGVKSIGDAVRHIEGSSFNEGTEAVAPMRFDGFSSPAEARVLNVSEHGQRLQVTVTSPGRALLFVNETYFHAWSARANGVDLPTLPLDLDRLGVMVPAGVSQVDLQFGRHHAAVAISWLVSIVVLAGSLAVSLTRMRALRGSEPPPFQPDRAIPQ